MIDFESLSEPDGDAGQLAQAGMLDGYTTGQLPPEFLCLEDRLLWQRVTLGALLGQQPVNPVERLVRGVLDDLRATRGGAALKVSAVLVGVRLAIAQTHGVRIRTHLRGIARHLGVRYQTLLKIRSLALKRLKADKVEIDVPDWLKWDWG